jgi:hypothetical protein
MHRCREPSVESSPHLPGKTADLQASRALELGEVAQGDPFTVCAGYDRVAVLNSPGATPISRLNALPKEASAS